MKKEMIKDSKKFTQDQKNEILLGLDQNVFDDSILERVDFSELHPNVIETIREAKIADNIDLITYIEKYPYLNDIDKILSIYRSVKYDKSSTSIINKEYLTGTEMNTLLFYIMYCDDEDENKIIKRIRKGITKILSMYHHIGNENLLNILHTLKVCKNDLNTTLVNPYKYTSLQLEQILKGYEEGIPESYIKKYAVKRLNPDQMEQLRLLYYVSPYGFSESYKHLYDLSANQLKENRLLLMIFNYRDITRTDAVNNILFEKDFSANTIRLIRLQYELNVDDDHLNKILKVVLDANPKKNLEDFIRLINKDIDIDQDLLDLCQYYNDEAIHQIILALESGINLLDKLEFLRGDATKIALTRIALENDVDEKYIMSSNISNEVLSLLIQAKIKNIELDDIKVRNISYDYILNKIRFAENGYFL